MQEMGRPTTGLKFNVHECGEQRKARDPARVVRRYCRCGLLWLTGNRTAVCNQGHSMTRESFL